MGARLGATRSRPLRAPRTSGRSAGRGVQQYATGTAALGPSGGVGPALSCRPSAVNAVGYSGLTAGPDRYYH